MSEQPEIEPIPPEQARQILDDAIHKKLGSNWQDEERGWAVVSRHDYMARLTRGSVNMDFYVDLLGNVTVEEKEINPAQDNGRLFAWMLLGGSIAVAFLIAYLAGLFN